LDTSGGRSGGGAAASGTAWPPVELDVATVVAPPVTPPVASIPPVSTIPPFAATPPEPNGFFTGVVEAVVVVLVVPPEAVLASGGVKTQGWPVGPVDKGWELQLHSARSIPAQSRNQRAAFQVTRTV
jgi:hypothetical protein